MIQSVQLFCHCSLQLSNIFFSTLSHNGNSPNYLWPENLRPEIFPVQDRESELTGGRALEGCDRPHSPSQRFDRKPTRRLESGWFEGIGATFR